MILYAYKIKSCSLPVTVRICLNGYVFPFLPVSGCKRIEPHQLQHCNDSRKQPYYFGKAVNPPRSQRFKRIQGNYKKDKVIAGNL